MTEVMVQSAVGEKFSFSESKFKHIESEKESELSLDDSNELDESTLCFNDKMDVASEKSSESTICGANSDDSHVADVQLNKKNLKHFADNAKDSDNSTMKNCVFGKDFEYMATETTVINTTYNVISQSAVGQRASPPCLSDDVDKSRVIVQILTSDLKDSGKSRDVIKNKSSTENQNTHSFRDDVFKILSQSQSSKSELESNRKKDFKVSDKWNACNNFQSVSPQIEGSTQIVRTRRKRSLKSFFLFGRGPKISDIEHVSTYLQAATPNALRIVHYVLYDKYGLCSSELQISQTRKNILHFCGYPFDQNSREFKKRSNCLMKIPFPILREVHEAIFGKTSVNTRISMVHQLMQFFLKPKRYNTIYDKLKQNMAFMLEEEYNALKETALKGPLPCVLIRRLETCDIQKIINQLRMSKEEEFIMPEDKKNLVEKESSDSKFSNYSLPAYILRGPGKKLKFFPSIVRNVENANEKDVNLLHYILYGRLESESVEICRRNILEFNGFLKCQTDFISERKATLIRLDQADLFELCKILCLRAKTNSRNRRIKKIMEYLQSPYNPLKIKGCRRKMKNPSNASYESKCIISEPSQKYSPVLFLDDSEKIENTGGWRLRDFRKICSNIECSASSDLTELNDLLFMKPCDETDIHEKILNFTNFGFPDTSVHYHYRKTLMHYMGPCIIRKIAKLLDIENWDKVPRHEDLSSSILNFLMEKKGPDSPSGKLSLSSSFPMHSLHSSFVQEPESQVKSFQSETLQHQMNQAAVIHHKESVFIHKLSKASVTNDLCRSNESTWINTSMEKRNEVLSCGSNSADEDAVPLRVFIHHPTDEEVKHTIHNIIKNNLWHITLGDLVQTVYSCYPDFDITYRESFIKTEARQILSELRSNAVNVVKQMNFNQINM